MPATKKVEEDESKRLTFWIGEHWAKRLKKNAKERKLPFPAYLCELVLDGLAAQERKQPRSRNA